RGRQMESTWCMEPHRESCSCWRFQRGAIPYRSVLEAVPPATDNCLQTEAPWLTFRTSQAETRSTSMHCPQKRDESTSPLPVEVRRAGATTAANCFSQHRAER